MPFILPEIEALFIVAVKGLQRRLQASGEFERVEFLALAAPFLGAIFADVLPEGAAHRHIFAGDVFRHRDGRPLDDAAFDGIHEREVAHRPWEQGALGRAGTAKDEWRHGQVNDAAEAKFSVHRLQAGNPNACCLVVLFGLFLLIAFQVFIIRVFWLLPVAVVCLISDDVDILHAHQVRHHALEHLTFGLLRVQFLTNAPLKELTSAFGQVNALAKFESVVVGDDDLGPVHIIEHVARNEFAAGVIAVGVVGLRTRNRSLIVKPGAQTRNPRVKCLLAGRRTALTVCQAMSMAMTVVLPAPVASFSASPSVRGWHLCSPTRDGQAGACRSRIGVRSQSASTWQKKGRTPLNS